VSTRYSSDFIDIEREKTGGAQTWKMFDGSAPRTNRLEFLQLGFHRVLTSGDPLTLESWACDLVAALGGGPADCHRRLYRSRQLRWYAERVEATKDILKRRPTEEHSLVSPARSVGMSTFQFARIFRELTGCPPHRHLLNIRLDRALQLLLDGTSSPRNGSSTPPVAISLIQSAPNRRQRSAHSP
jgi:AraC-like DNA-binding protein